MPPPSERRRRYAETFTSQTRRSDTQAERLETNTSMPYITRATASGPASRVYGTPSNGFWLAPSLSLTAQITRGCLAPSAIRAAAHVAAVAPSRTIESLFIDLFS